MGIFKKKRISRSECLIAGSENYTSRLDGYMRLRDNVLFLSDGGKNKTIQIESSVSGELKTTTVSNLAVLLGASGKKVLIMDLDFRRAGIHKVFGVDGDSGLAEYMLETATLDKAIKPTAYKNVDVLPRGGTIHNSAVVLISDRFANLIEELRGQYDIILFDSSPVLQMSDYIHITKFSDVTLLLVAYGKTKKSQIRETVKELKKAGANIAGTVFTYYLSMPQRGRYYYNKYYYRKED